MVVAVEGFDIHAGLSHPACEPTQLAGHVLLQSLNEHFAFLKYLDASSLEHPAGGGAVRKQEMGQPVAVHDPSPSALDAHPTAAQHLSHFSQGTRLVFQNDFQIPHRVPPGCLRLMSRTCRNWLASHVGPDGTRNKTLRSEE